MYEIRERPPSVETFQRLRERVDMARRPTEGVRRGLGNEVFAVTVVAVGDGRSVYE